MSSTFDVHIATLPIGAFNGATEIPLAYIDDEGGGISVLSAYICGTGAGTVIGGKIVTMSNQGTPAINGTVGTFAGTVVTAAGVVAALTVATPYVGGDKWLGFDQTSGTVPAGAFISLNYVMGK